MGLKQFASEATPTAFVLSWRLRHGEQDLDGSLRLPPGGDERRLSSPQSFTVSQHFKFRNLNVEHLFLGLPVNKQLCEVSLCTYQQGLHEGVKQWVGDCGKAAAGREARYSPAMPA